MTASGRYDARRRRAARRPDRAHPLASAEPVHFRGGKEPRAIVAVEQPLRDYVGSPYDPTYAIGAAPFISRGVLAAASAGGWLRVGAAVIMVFMAISAIGALVLTITTLDQRSGFWLVNALWSAIFAFIFGAFAVAIARRLWVSHSAA